MLFDSKNAFARLQSEQYSVEYITIWVGVVEYRSLKAGLLERNWLSIGIFYLSTVFRYSRTENKDTNFLDNIAFINYMLNSSDLFGACVIIGTQHILDFLLHGDLFALWWPNIKFSVWIHREIKVVLRKKKLLRGF